MAGLCAELLGFWVHCLLVTMRPRKLSLLLSALFSGAAADFFGISPGATPGVIADEAKIRAETHELIRPEQLSTGASQANELIHERISDLVTSEVEEGVKRAVSERVRVADIQKWLTSITVPGKRLDRLGNWAAVFRGTKRSEGFFDVKEDTKDYKTKLKISVSPTGFADKTPNLAVAARIAEDLHLQAFEKYSQRVDTSDENWMRQFKTATSSIYEFREDLLCGQLLIAHTPIKPGLANTQKYLNVRLPVTFVRVHLTNPRAKPRTSYEGSAHLSPESAMQGLGPYRQEPYIIARSDWRYIAAEPLQVIGIDKPAAAPAQAALRLDFGIMRDAQAFSNSTGCSQSEIISREGYANFCVHMGDDLNHHKAASLLPGDAFALKCAGLYPHGTIVLSRRYRDHVDPETQVHTRDIRLVANVCRLNEWSADLSIQPER